MGKVEQLDGADVCKMVELLTDLLACCQEIDANTDEIEAKLDEQIALLTSIDDKVATETTLAAVLADTTAIIAELVTLNGVDFATETTLASLLSCCADVLTEVTALNAKDFATETTLAAIGVDIAALEVLLTSIDGKDFATQTTLDALLTCCAAIQAQTDQLEFTDGKLRTTGEDGGGGGGGGCCTGPNATQSLHPFALPAASAQLAPADTDRIQILINNDTNRNIWLSYTGAAAVGQGVLIRKATDFVEDKYTGAITYIQDGPGAISGTLTSTIVTT